MKYPSEYDEISSDENERHKLLLQKFSKNDLGKLDYYYKQLKSIELNTYKFILYLIPEASPRPRYSHRFHTFYVKGSQENHQLFHEIMSVLGDIPVITTATKIRITSYLPTPKTMNRFEKYFAELKMINAISTPDWDNLAKTYCDMITGALILDDRLIFSGLSEKYYSIKPRIEIEVIYADIYDCKFNKKRVESSVIYKKQKFETELSAVLEVIKK